MIPKGRILIIGGAEDRGGNDIPEIRSKNRHFQHFEILKELLSEKKSGKLEIVTSGTESPDEVGAMYKKAFKEMGYKDPGFMHIENKQQARDKQFSDRVSKADAVLFSGGDQLKISTILGGTPFSEALQDKYLHEKNFVVAGTSAGAMVFSNIMICGGGTEEALFDTDLKLASGFGLLDQCIIDTHFIKRGRFARLAHAVMINPGQLGIGLGEDTSLIIKNGYDAVCRGSGTVIIIDGKDIDQTNINSAESGTPVFVENLRVHILVDNCRFSIRERKLAVPAISPRAK